MKRGTQGSQRAAMLASENTVIGDSPPEGAAKQTGGVVERAQAVTDGEWRCLLTSLWPFAATPSIPSTRVSVSLSFTVGGLPLARCAEVARAGAGGPAARLATTMVQEYGL